MNQTTTIRAALALYLNTLERDNTKEKIYKTFLNLYDQAFLFQDWTLEMLACQNINAILDNIRALLSCKKDPSKRLADSTRQAAAGYFIGFTRFLQRQTNGYVQEAIPNKEAGASKTYGHRKEVTVAEVLSPEKIKAFMTALESICLRGWLFAALQLHGAKRKSEIQLSLIENVDFEHNTIKYVPAKGGRVMKKVLIITYPQEVMNKLKIHLTQERMYPQNNTGYIFTDPKDQDLAKLPNQRRCIPTTTIESYYRRAWRTTPYPLPRSLTHCLRCTTITHLISKQEKYEDISLLTGQCLSAISYYDKSDNLNNPSKRLCILPE